VGAAPTSPQLLLRALVICFLMTGGAILAVTGLVLYFAPSGPHSGQERVLGLAKGFWRDLHAYTAFSMFAIAAAHITLNRRALVEYLSLALE
jgi:cytochrome b subunit of formate dehydrogenase